MSQTETIQTETLKSLSKTRDIDFMSCLVQFQFVYIPFFVGIYYFLDAGWSTIFFTFTLALLGITGVTAGSHRLWAHNSYKATPGLRLLLVLCQTLACHGSVYDWVRWHRLHHKHFGTDLDPYNPSKGLWYSQLTNLMYKLSPAQEKELESIDMSDVEQDKIVMFQKKYYILFFIILGILLPLNTPAEYFGERMFVSLVIAVSLRVGLIQIASNTINSATRIWGLAPGEKYPSDTNLVFILTKTNWLSYHYMAPWDYKTSEYGKYGEDCVSKLIQIFAVLNMATDLRSIECCDVRQALSDTIKSKKSISECLLERQTISHQFIFRRF